METQMTEFRRIKFDEKVKSSEYKTTTLYFTAPKELLNKKYPDAESTEISIEFPTAYPDANHATVMASPTKDGLDYEWFDLEMTNEDINALIALADM